VIAVRQNRKSTDCPFVMGLPSALGEQKPILPEHLRMNGVNSASLHVSLA
jgi:hypothetical protein